LVGADKALPRGVNFIGGFSLWFTGYDQGDLSLIKAIPTPWPDERSAHRSTSVPTKAGINMDAVYNDGNVIKETAERPQIKMPSGVPNLWYFAMHGG
jgi:uncharacterized protein (UPF0210 family)